jgi:hypothetical protein
MFNVDQLQTRYWMWLVFQLFMPLIELILMRLKNSQVEDQLTLPNTCYIDGATLVDDLLNAELKSLVHTKPIRLLKFKTRIDSDIQTYIFI